MTERLAVEAFALKVAAFFEHKGDPFYGVEVRPGQPFPLVVLWDDNAQVTRVMACCLAAWEVEDAACYARAMAVAEEENGGAVCGATGCGVWPEGWLDING